MTVVTNEKNKLVPTRIITGWRVCIDYRKLNEATPKDHFSLPFMDQMLERLAGNKFFCFLNGFSGYFQISIEPADQEKTTFTYPYGTYAYKRMPFGLCNAPATSQRCMIAIFQDMLENSMEVFMDDFLEKCHFMVTEGIVLGHKLFSAGLEVDKAKIDVIAKLPPPTNELSDEDIDDNFPDETLMNVSSNNEDEIPWFADFSNYLVGKFIRKGLTYAQMIRICVYGSETQKILDECHHGPTGGHYGPSTTTKKVFDADFYWPTILKRLILSFKTVMLANVLVAFHVEMRCLKTASKIRKEFKARDKVLLYNSKYKFKAPKLRSKWYGPFMVKHGFPSGYVELYDKHGGSFIFNGHRVKLYHDEEQINNLTTKEIHLMLEEGKMKAIPFMTPFPADYRKTMPWVAKKPFIYSVVENTCNKAKLYDLDEIGKGIVKGNFLYIKKDPSEKPPLEEK
ncbi:reverse transcriptase domain-containing protein [Tanacetum coccineum]